MLSARPIGDTWRVSSWSKSGNCVEITTIGTAVLVRDTKNRGGEVLSFSSIVWDHFIEQSKQTKLA